ncbi:membrane protein insertase YidC [Candidatus Falkowbacteria bacterium]|jgi:YidC/Oxa1 family membrane protein insertase|nr:membrane protein insertase YidC [Candidatus Falkowbacteria bacterium]MBT7007435.1 membrane protein insertase YidC [Candidatus Falkowbacteria bacterium]
MIELYNTILYEPVLNLLIYLYNIIPGNDIGIAIIVLTVIIKLILLPFSAQSIKSQKALQEIQPKLEALKKKYKDDKEKLASETMLLYKEQKVNPLSSCLPLLIQFPFLIAVYQAFRTGLGSKEIDQYLYSFVANPEHINTITLNFVDLAQASIALAVLAGLAQFIQTKMLSTKPKKATSSGAKDEALMANMNKSMIYFMPLITIVIGAQLPAGLTLYWFTTTVLTVLQQKLIFKTLKDKPVEVIPPDNKKNESKKDEPVETPDVKKLD